MESKEEIMELLQNLGKEGADDESASDYLEFLKEIGLTEDQMKALIMKIPQVVGELIQGRNQYVEEEKQLISIREKITRQIGDLLVQNINASRNFFLTLATLSLTVIGAVVSVQAGGHVFFKGVITLHIGLFFLAVCIVASVLYLLDRLSAENNNLTKSLEMQQSGLVKLIELMREYASSMKPFEEYFAIRKDLLESNKELGDAFDKKVKKQSWLIKHTPVIIGYAFLIGLAFIALAFII